ncbi:hypothetical protein [Paenibacillus koleovorans]|nr:hypothetical protein [Paenibacillus koleovorans]
MPKRNTPVHKTNKFEDDHMKTLKAVKAAATPPSLNNLPKQNNPQ